MDVYDAPEGAIRIRNIGTLAELRAVEEVQREVWGPDDVVPLTHLIAAVEVGAILTGAFDERELVGFVYGFIGRESNHTVIHSHMLAVKPAYRNHALGYRLKLAQREQALARGFERITWTFDPLQSRNAHLNFQKLGVIADQYKIDFYGDERQSPLDRHIGTDRLWVTWLLRSVRVLRRLETVSEAEHLAPALERTAALLVESNSDGEPVHVEKAEGLEDEHVLIEIPLDIGRLQQHEPQLAVAWRAATRRAFTEALAAGYFVEEFYRRSRKGRQLGAYLLSRRRGQRGAR
ncbi:MAG TPA: GNAT family N-acetyltransferase [Pyrinomonadaceae bacterium]|jgi:predicted GNAT superfamily acetyltransferase|nr:GNAT family N-acetyltransferase [Pyrinomonadaceae bacterium]